MLRTELRADLAGIKIALQEREKKDFITQNCQNWHQEFSAELRKEADDESTIAHRTRLLQKILRDEMPFFYSPLEEQSYLGNDGKVYGHQALCCYLQAIPSSLKGKSPITPETGDLFFVEEKPHSVVKVCVQWLKKRNQALPPHPNIQFQFAALEKIPPLPTEKVAKRQEKIRHIQQEQEKNRLQIHAARENRREEETKRICDRVARVFGQIRPQAADQKVPVSEETFHAQNLSALSVEFFEREKHLFAQKIQELDMRIDCLETELQQEAQLLTETQRETIKLEVEIRKTEKMLEERNAKAAEGGGWWIAVAAVVITVTGTALSGGQGFIAAARNGIQAGAIIPI
ncbi:MAG: hypothetical protein KGI80_04715 [Verrucomicrobiota bacterium]|nr:hypothetical protein [Verrucomicrobiota bacterium]